MKKKFKNTLTIISAILLLVSMIFIPMSDVQAEGEIVIDVATVDIEEPVAGGHPSFQETVGDSSKYYIDVDYTKWVQQFSPYNNVWDDYTFEAGKIYSYRVLFRPKSGYTFSDDTLFLINGKKTGKWGDDKAMAYQYFYVVDQETDVNIDFRYKDENDVYVSFSQTSIKLNSTVNPPATNPTKNGFTFVKWTTANGYDVDFNDAINSNRDFFAEFVSNENLQTHTITLNPNNGTDESDSINNIVSGSINKLGTLDSYEFTIPDGKQFYGWKVGEEVYLPGEYFEVTSNLTAVAQYIGSTVPTTSQVTFNLNGGTMTETNPQVVNNGENATKPATNPTKSGYAFVNWYADAGLNIPFDFTNTTINSDTIIYAKWNKLITSASATITAPVGGEHPLFTVTSGNSDAYSAIIDTWYDLNNNGAHLTNSDTFVAGNEYQARIHFTANDGYQFADSVTYTINETPNYTTFDNAQQRGMNFTATAPTTSQVTFNLNGGTMTGTNPQVVNNGGNATKPATNPTCDGHVFAGWYADAGLNIPFDFTNTTINSDTTIYAKWDIAITTASATVTAPVNGEHPDFNPVSGDSSLYTVIANTWYLHEDPYPTLTAESVYETGKKYSFRLTFTPKAGYQFTNDTTFTVNGESTAKYGSIGDREYYVVASSPLTYKVSFDKNGGTGTMADVTGLSGTYTLPANGFTAPTNKQFKGWSLTSDGAIITTLEMTEDKTVYAIWEDIPAVTYTITFNANGGSGTMAPIVDLTGEYTLPANKFTAPSGKQFKGWSLTTDGAIVTKVDMTEDKTVYAIWEDIPAVTYTITEGNNQTYTKGSNTDIVIKASGDLAKINSIEIDGGNVIDPANYELTSGSTILTLKSSFLENSSIGQHTITFKYNDGEVDATLTVAETSNNNNNNDNGNTNTNINDNTNTNTNNNNSNNPQTSYNVVDYVYTLIIGIICLAGGTIYLKRKKLFGNR